MQHSWPPTAPYRRLLGMQQAAMPVPADGLSACGAHAQPFNVLRYEPGQHYDSHYDIFEPESYGPQASQRVRGWDPNRMRPRTEECSALRGRIPTARG